MSVELYHKGETGVEPFILFFPNMKTGTEDIDILYIKKKINFKLYYF